MLKIGILQTDSVLAQFQAEHGNYPEMFSRLLCNAALECSPPLRIEIETFDVQNESCPAVDACDGYVITGSRDSVYDDLPWIDQLVEFLRAAMAAERKIVGICFGHQLIAHFFGGETGPASQGWAVGAHNTQLLVDEAWMIPPRSNFRLISSHKDQVRRLPDSARLIATTEFCPLAGFTLGDNVLTWQGHPEFNEGYATSLLEMRRELIGDRVVDLALESFGERADQEVVGRWMLNFLAA